MEKNIFNCVCFDFYKTYQIIKEIQLNRHRKFHGQRNFETASKYQVQISYRKIVGNTQKAMQ